MEARTLVLKVECCADCVCFSIKGTVKDDSGRVGCVCDHPKGIKARYYVKPHVYLSSFLEGCPLEKKNGMEEADVIPCHRCKYSCEDQKLRFTMYCKKTGRRWTIKNIMADKTDGYVEPHCPRLKKRTKTDG